jgi:hypothetical protein
MSETSEDVVANCVQSGILQPYSTYMQLQQPGFPTQTQSVGKVYASIMQVMDEIGRVGISKDREVSFGQKYKFRGIEDALNALNVCLVQAKLVIIPYVVSCDMSRNDKTNICKMVVDYKIVNVEDGSHTVMRIMTEAFSSGDDKGPGKALSYAYKSGMFQLFCIPTEPGVLPDQDEGKPAPRQETKPQSRPENRPPQPPQQPQRPAARAPAEPPRVKLAKSKYDGQPLVDVPVGDLSTYFGQLTHIDTEPKFQGALNRRMYEAVTEISKRIHLLTNDELAKYAERLERLPNSETGLWDRANEAKDLEWNKRVEAETPKVSK